jgi:hypothetical protein
MLSPRVECELIRFTSLHRTGRSTHGVWICQHARVHGLMEALRISCRITRTSAPFGEAGETLYSHRWVLGL